MSRPRYVIDIPGWSCDRCGHTWVSRAVRRALNQSAAALRRAAQHRPQVCPHCRSHQWDAGAKGGR